MVAGEHAEAAGIYRQGLRKAVFRGKICDKKILRDGTFYLIPPGLAIHIDFAPFDDRFHPEKKALVGSHLVQALLCDIIKQFNRIVRCFGLYP
jgi:hypothetical protein